MAQITKDNINLLPGCVIKIDKHGHTGLVAEVSFISPEENRDFYEFLGLPVQPADYLVTYKRTDDKHPAPDQWKYVWVRDDGVIMDNGEPLEILHREKQAQVALFGEAV